MSAHVLLKLLNKLGKRPIERIAEHFSLFCNEFDKFNNTRARMSDSYDHKTTLKWHFLA